MGLSSADIFFKISFFFLLFFLKTISVISVECQAIWIQIMPVRSDLGLNCLQGYQQTTLVSKEFMTAIQGN